MGLKVSVFKCGPDYLDPSYHFRAAGVHSQTLDSWMMGREGVLSTYQHAAQWSDVAVIEGVMGLFDGVEPTSNAGSTAEIAKWLGAPVLLVIDASGMSRSVAAMANGFASFDAEVRLAGIICNRVGSKKHLEMLTAASNTVPVLGGLPEDADHSFPGRHLGLITATCASLPDETFDAWSGHVAEWCDVEKILAIARTTVSFSSFAVQSEPPQRQSCRIGVAVDEAFNFYYDENLRLLRDAGAELVEFSPISSTTLPKVDGLYLGGGYPEVYAEALAANEGVRREIFTFCHSGKPVYAECGGLMYLCDQIRQLKGPHYSMVGWFAANVIMSDRLQALGYVEVITSRDTILGPAGQTFRGHQFRYSTLDWKDSASTSAYDIERRGDRKTFKEGFVKRRVLASYVHAHWASNPSVAKQFVESCIYTNKGNEVSYTH